MLVYRVEFSMSMFRYYRKMLSGIRTKIGPYAGCYYAPSDTAVWLDDLGLTTNPDLEYHKHRQPEPDDDDGLMSCLERARIGYTDSDNLYGFSSLEQLSNWFVQHERSYLKMCGYQCMVYECETVFIGDKQCIFSNRKSNLTGIIDLETLETLL